MINSDERKRKEAFLEVLKGIQSYWLSKIYNYKERIRRFEISSSQRTFKEKFNERLQFFENEIAIKRRLLDEEEKSPGYMERMRDKSLFGEKRHKELQKIQPLLKPLDYKTYAEITYRNYDIEHAKKSIENLGKAIVEMFDERERYSVWEIKIEKLTIKVEKLMSKVQKLKEFINEESKKLNRKKNKDLFDLFENMKRI